MYKKSASEINIDLLKKHELDDYLTSLSMDDKELKYLDEQRLLLKILGNKPHLAIQLLIHLDWYQPQSAFQLAQKISEEYGRDLTSGNNLLFITTFLRRLTKLNYLTKETIKDSLNRKIEGYTLKKEKQLLSFLTLKNLIEHQKKPLIDFFAVIIYFNEKIGTVMDKNNRPISFDISIIITQLVQTGLQLDTSMDVINICFPQFYRDMPTNEILDIVCQALNHIDPTGILSQTFRRINSGVVWVREMQREIKYSDISALISEINPDSSGSIANKMADEVLSKLRILGFRSLSFETIRAIVSEEIASFQTENDYAVSKSLFKQVNHEMIKSDIKTAALKLQRTGYHLLKALFHQVAVIPPETAQGVFSNSTKVVQNYVQESFKQSDPGRKSFEFIALRTAKNLFKMSSRVEYITDDNYYMVEEIYEGIEAMLEYLDLIIENM